MLLYLHVRRYILQKDIFLCKLYVTPNEIVYKLSRPSFIPFCKITTIERHIPLNLLVDIIIEQGCLQSNYGIHTFRIESVIITEASKTIQDVGKSWKPTAIAAKGGSMARTGSLTKGLAVMRSPVKSLKIIMEPQISNLFSKLLFKDFQNFHSIRWFKLFEKNKNKNLRTSILEEKRKTPMFQINS
ncbi:hypothetical protein UlMin_012648 [Ulmus minor]